MKELLRKMVQAGASDLILEADSCLAMRINGRLKLEEKTHTAQDIVSLLQPLLTAAQKQRLEKERQLDFAYQLPSGERFRMNYHYQKGSLAAAVRSIPKNVPSKKELNLPSAVDELTRLKSGLVIVTGPTGSGKTTTQAYMVEAINQIRSEHILTIEDPIEYVIENKKSIIEQREVGSDVIDFASGLRAALRENPNVILIGEMRDLETISTAITAAETGHLVISTLHTANAVNAIDRMIDVFPAHQQSQIRSQLALTLQAAIAQQLLPRLDKAGLIVAMEILKGTPAVRNLIRKGQTHEIPSTMEISKRYGMQTMDAALVDLVKKKIIGREDALAHAISVENLEKMLIGSSKS